MEKENSEKTTVTLDKSHTQTLQVGSGGRAAVYTGSGAQTASLRPALPGRFLIALEVSGCCHSHTAPEGEGGKVVEGGSLPCHVAVHTGIRLVFPQCQPTAITKTLKASLKA